VRYGPLESAEVRFWREEVQELRRDIAVLWLGWIAVAFVVVVGGWLGTGEMSRSSQTCSVCGSSLAGHRADASYCSNCL